MYYKKHPEKSFGGAIDSVTQQYGRTRYVKRFGLNFTIRIHATPLLLNHFDNDRNGQVFYAHNISK